MKKTGAKFMVVLMCLMQAAKQEDEWLENRKREENE